MKKIILAVAFIAFSHGALNVSTNYVTPKMDFIPPAPTAFCFLDGSCYQAPTTQDQYQPVCFQGICYQPNSQGFINQ